MSVLHLVSKSPLESRALEHCVSRAGPEDAVLLLGSAVYAALARLPVAEQRLPALAPRPVYVLVDDLLSRGFSASDLIHGPDLVGYAEFVELAVLYPRSISWS